MRSGRSSRRHRQGRAVTDIELGAMPGAGDAKTIKYALAQWSAVVRANVVDRPEFATDVKQHDQPVFDFDNLLAGIRQVGRFGDANKFRHGTRVRKNLVGYAPRAYRNLWDQTRFVGT